MNCRILQCTIREGNEESIGLFKKMGFFQVSQFYYDRSGNNVSVWHKVLIPIESRIDTPEGLDEQLQIICKNVNDRLWDAYDCSSRKIQILNRSSRIIFPRYGRESESEIRVSEQEARFAFVEPLRNSEFLYSIETPTKKNYQFSGSSPISAQTDLTLYDFKGNSIVNVEFKAKGRTPSAKSKEDIYKDLQKLLRESELGLWYHLLESVNNSTIPDLLEVLTTETGRVLNNFKNDVVVKILIIHICVLRHRFSIHKKVLINRSDPEFLDELRNQLSISLKVSSSKLLKIRNSNDWTIYNRNNLCHVEPM